MKLHDDYRYMCKVSGYIYDYDELSRDLFIAFEEKDESWDYKYGDTYEEFKERVLEECFKVVELDDIKQSMPILVKVQISIDLLDYSDDIENAILEQYESAEVDIIKISQESNHCSIADISYHNNDCCNTRTFEAHAHADITRIMSDIIT